MTRMMIQVQKSLLLRQIARNFLDDLFHRKTKKMARLDGGIYFFL